MLGTHNFTKYLNPIRPHNTSYRNPPLNRLRYLNRYPINNRVTLKIGEARHEGAGFLGRWVIGGLAEEGVGRLPADDFHLQSVEERGEAEKGEREEAHQCHRHCRPSSRVADD